MTEPNVKTWALHTAYVQANPVLGYRYLDLAGTALNKLTPRYEKVDVVDPRGTKLSSPRDPSDPFAIAFSADRIWLQYGGIENLSHVVNTAPSIIRDIAESFEVLEFNRLGVRVIYFIEADDVLDAAHQVTQRIIGGRLAELLTKSPRTDLVTTIEVPIALGEKETFVRFKWVTTSGPALQVIDFPGPGIMLDIDIGQRPVGTNYRRRETERLIKAAAETHQELLVDLGHSLVEGIAI